MDPLSLTAAAISALASLASFVHAARRFKAKRAEQVRVQGEAHMEVGDTVRRIERRAATASKSPPKQKSRGKLRAAWDRVEAGGRKYPVALNFLSGCFFSALALAFASSSTGSDHGPTASITEPEDGVSVPYQVRVEGSSEDIPLAVDPWLFVESTDHYFYPQGADYGNSVEINRRDGSWCGYAYFGAAKPSAAGNTYTLYLVIPEDKADDELQAEMEEGPPVPQLTNLPEGQIADTRTVKRLPDSRSTDPSSCRRQGS